MTRQIRLRWKSHKGSLLSSFDSFLSKEVLVDVTLACEGKHVNAHKVILSACSPYFEELLTVDPTKHPIIFLKDTSYEELKALIEYMYRGEVSIPEGSLHNLILLAQALKIRGLAELDSLMPDSQPQLIRNGKNLDYSQLETASSQSPTVAASVFSSSTTKAVPPHHQYPKNESSHPLRTVFSSPLTSYSEINTNTSTETNNSLYETTFNIEGCEVSQFEIESEGHDLSNTIYEDDELDESDDDPLVINDDNEIRVMNFREETLDTSSEDGEKKLDLGNANSLSFTARINVESSSLKRPSRLRSSGKGGVKNHSRSAEAELISHRKGRRTKICRFQCPNVGCGRYYSQKSSLKRHMDFECYKEPKFICPFCGLKSKLRGNAEIHEKRCKFRQAAFTHHNNELL